MVEGISLAVGRAGNGRGKFNYGLKVVRIVSFVQLWLWGPSLSPHCFLWLYAFLSLQLSERISSPPIVPPASSFLRPLMNVLSWMRSGTASIAAAR